MVEWARAPRAPMRVNSVAVSDVGRRRTINEDAFFRDDGRGFYVVADGVGGHSKGEVASQESVEQLRMWVFGAAGHLEHFLARAHESQETRHEVRRLLESGVQSACYMVYG